MMNSKKYAMNSYVPTKPTVKTHDLHTRLQEITFNEVFNNPEKHFDNVYVTNFDLIHHQCRGDPLQKENIELELMKQNIFLSSMKKKALKKATVTF